MKSMVATRTTTHPLIILPERLPCFKRVPSETMTGEVPLLEAVSVASGLAGLAGCTVTVSRAVLLSAPTVLGVAGAVKFSEMQVLLSTSR